MEVCVILSVQNFVLKGKINPMTVLGKMKCIQFTSTDRYGFNFIFKICLSQTLYIEIQRVSVCPQGAYHREFKQPAPIHERQYTNEHQPDLWCKIYKNNILIPNLQQLAQETCPLSTLTSSESQPALCKLDLSKVRRLFLGTSPGSQTITAVGNSPKWPGLDLYLTVSSFFFFGLYFHLLTSQRKPNRHPNQPHGNPVPRWPTPPLPRPTASNQGGTFPVLSEALPAPACPEFLPEASGDG